MKRVFGGIMLSFIMALAAPAGAEETHVEKAIFGAGCFWGVEKVFGDLPGVISTQVGYTGGTRKNPTYQEVCEGDTGHAEAIEITYDPSKIGYQDLLEIFWTHHDPTTRDRQGNDVGHQYRSAIFYTTEAQRVAAEKNFRALEDAHVYRDPITTEIAPADTFYRAEEYHQKYLKKNPFGYCHLLLQPKKVLDVLRRSTK